MSVPYRQDMPPAGGFEAVKYKRNLPTRGPGAYAILGGVTAICAYGFYRLGLGNLERRGSTDLDGGACFRLDPAALLPGRRLTAVLHLCCAICNTSILHLAGEYEYEWELIGRELEREKAWSRIHLVPMLLAEADRDEYRRTEASKAREAEVMKNVKGWETGKRFGSSVVLA
ncbi:hypothetical protein D9619_000608 [Psilocybe cf. subviscida]|uniref:NADH dehydrogenase [ubiquinone] 1 alpha subcomplex subunit 13 n=1 Tax=Psilocybe cf. subviscida TaxID=2480587 RepID=A0A8H5BG84_9AGAR|nr:hypothetical protein D9619_000608 [Psilocybe cf. subviscida]